MGEERLLIAQDRDGWFLTNPEGWEKRNSRCYSRAAAEKLRDEWLREVEENEKEEQS